MCRYELDPLLLTLTILTGSSVLDPAAAAFGQVPGPGTEAVGAGEVALLGADSVLPERLARSAGGDERAQDPLRIQGLDDRMTGWRRLEALTSERDVARVEWRVNGRSYPSTSPWSAELYFGITPQPRTIEVRAFGRDGSLRYSLAETVNGGGSAQLLDFLSPLAGDRVVGATAIEVCAHAPADRPIAGVRLRLEGDDGATDGIEAQPAGRGRCRVGTSYRGSFDLDDAPSLITAELLTAGGAYGATGSAAEPRPSLESTVPVNMLPGVQERVEVRLLEWPVRVLRGGEPVSDLEREDFLLWEDRRRCPIRQVLGLEDVPLRLALVFDWSGSTVLDASAEAKAASELMEQLFDSSKDSVLIEAIADSPIRYLGWTSDPERIRAALDSVRAGHRFPGGTALYDTLVEALYAFQGSLKRGLPAVVVLTDGLDTASVDFDREQLLAYARESGVPIFPIAVRARVDRRHTTKVDLGLLQALAEVSGGRLYTVELDARPADLLSRAQALRSEALSLREHPGELAQDQRFLRHLIAEREKEIVALEARAERLQQRNLRPLDEIGRAFARIARDLSSGYLIVAEGRAPRSDRWHPVEVELAQSSGAYEVRGPKGLHW